MDGTSATHPREDAGLSRRNLLVAGGFTALGLASFRAFGLGSLSVPAHAAIPWQLPFTFPPRISSPFGWRTDPEDGTRKHHNGLDYSGPPSSGTPIYAVAPGVVISSGFNPGGFGNNITIDHGSGYKSLYGHMLDGSRLPKGSEVTSTTVVGKVGSTGKSTGPHLHLEIYVNDVAQDPAPYMLNAPIAGSTVTPATPPLNRKSMYIVRDVVNGTGSFVVTDNGVWGINGAQEEVLWRIMGSPNPAYVPLAASEITMIDQVLRANTNFND